MIHMRYNPNKPPDKSVYVYCVPLLLAYILYRGALNLSVALPENVENP